MRLHIRRNTLIIALAGVALFIGVRVGRSGHLTSAQEEDSSLGAPSRVSLEQGESFITLDRATQFKSGIVVSPLEPHAYAPELHVQGIVVEAGTSSVTQGSLAPEHVVLVQIVPSGRAYLLVAPPTASIQVADGTRASASLIVTPQASDVGRLPMYRLDLSERQASECFPGMSVTVSLPVGSLVDGVVVPESAVIWHEGKSWVYVRDTPAGPGALEKLPDRTETTRGQPLTLVDRFVRREISTDTPVAGGWFVAKAVSAGTPVVTTGAQMLLSEEFRSQIPSEE